MRLNLETVTKIATRLGWIEIEVPGDAGLTCVAFHNGHAKKHPNRIRINVWNSGKASVALKHPNKGANQMYKNNLDYLVLAAIFNKPRVHTNTGYRRKDQAKRRKLQNPKLKRDELARLQRGPECYDRQRYPNMTWDQLALAFVHQVDPAALQRADNLQAEVVLAEKRIRNGAEVNPEILKGYLTNRMRMVNEALGFDYYYPTFKPRNDNQI